MQLDYLQYRTLLIAALDDQRNRKIISPFLDDPKPGNIRQECIHVYKEQWEKGTFERKDEQTLRAFFGPAEHGKAMLRLMEGFSPDKFRPVRSILLRGSNGDQKYFELIAWLIGFKHRPYRFGMEIIPGDDESHWLKNSNFQLEQPALAEKETNEQVVEEINIASDASIKAGEVDNSSSSNSIDEPLPVAVHDGYSSTVQLPEDNKQLPRNKGWRSSISRSVLAATIGLAGFAGGYMLINSGKAADDGSCMYWSVDHYERIACNDNQPGRVKVAFDEQRFRYLKKIQREDTVTERSIEVIYYAKRDNKLELFTAGGTHPVFPNQYLRRLSANMYSKYLDRRTDKADPPQNAAILKTR